MSRRINARGQSLLEALTRAVADLAGCEPDEVDLKLHAPNLEADAEATVKVSVELVTPRPTDDDADEDEGPTGPTPEELDAEAEAAADFLEGLLDVMELPGDLKLRLYEDHAEVEVVEVGSGALIGRRGQTLEAIQELMRCSLQREFQRRTRVQVDVEGYRERRLEKFREKALEAIDTVLGGGEAERLEPMDVFERKAIHQLVAQHEGVSSRSQGREPGRRVIIERD